MKTDTSARAGAGPSEKVRLGSRKSPLALAQAEMAAVAIGRLRPGTAVEIVGITSEGDRDQDTRLDRFSQPGVFTRALERALCEGRIDGAVHSAKDLPSALEPGFRLTGTLPREDAHDTLVGRRGEAIALASLKEGARIGSCSPRRIAQLSRVRGDLRFRELRGNLQTRLAKLEAGEVDAVLLAAAGLKRLGLEGRICESIPFELCLPAAGQGIVAVECLGESAFVGLFDGIAFGESLICLEAERAVLRALGAGCAAAVAAHAAVRDGELNLIGRVLDVAGERLIEGEERIALAGSGDRLAASAAGTRLGEKLLAEGAAALL